MGELHEWNNMDGDSKYDHVTALHRNFTNNLLQGSRSKRTLFFCLFNDSNGSYYELLDGCNQHRLEHGFQLERKCSAYNFVPGCIYSVGVLRANCWQCSPCNHQFAYI